MKERVINVIKTVIAEHAELTQNEFIEHPDEFTPLIGRESRIDSIGLVTIIVATEQKIEEEFGATITLADEKAMSQKNSPFLTVSSLAEYIQKLLAGSNNEH